MPDVFIAVPVGALDCARSVLEKGWVLHLAELAHINNWEAFSVSERRLASEWDTSRSSVRRFLARLEEASVLVVEDSGARPGAERNACRRLRLVSPLRRKRARKASHPVNHKAYHQDPPHEPIHKDSEPPQEPQGVPVYKKIPYGDLRSPPTVPPQGDTPLESLQLSLDVLDAFGRALPQPIRSVEDLQRVSRRELTHGRWGAQPMFRGIGERKADAIEEAMARLGRRLKDEVTTTSAGREATRLFKEVYRSKRGVNYRWPSGQERACRKAQERIAEFFELPQERELLSAAIALYLDEEGRGRGTTRPFGVWPHDAAPGLPKFSRGLERWRAQVEGKVTSLFGEAGTIPSGHAGGRYGDR